MVDQNSDVDGIDDDVVDVHSGNEYKQQKTSDKPDLSGLEDAFLVNDDRCVAIIKQGEKIVIERYSATLSGAPWLDTRVYVFIGYDPESTRVELIDEEHGYQALSNVRRGLSLGFKFKILPKSGKLPKFKRGRKKKIKARAKRASKR